jgi:hypothetical protein
MPESTMHDCGSFGYGICETKMVWLAVTDNMYMMGFITRHPWYRRYDSGIKSEAN